MKAVVLAMHNIMEKNVEKISIGAFVIWLFHISAMIGVSIGFFDWFVTKTPLNLIIGILILGFLFPINSKKLFLAFSIFVGVGIFSEWLGVNYGLIFGDYIYGNNLGPKVGGVPFLIGVNWAILVFITANIAEKWIATKWIRPIVGSLLMVFLDFFMEGVAPTFDFWKFADGLAPIQNYIGWFSVAFVLQLAYVLLKLKGNYRISMHLYFCQLVFFVYFYAYYST
jgi:putative membrane protein